MLKFTIDTITISDVRVIANHLSKIFKIIIPDYNKNQDDNIGLLLNDLPLLILNNDETMEQLFKIAEHCYLESFEKLNLKDQLNIIQMIFDLISKLDLIGFFLKTTTTLSQLIRE